MAAADEQGARILSGLDSPTGASQHASQDDTLKDAPVDEAVAAGGEIAKKPSAEVVATEADEEEEEEEVKAGPAKTVTKPS